MFAIKIQRVLYITLAWIWIAKKVSMNVLNSDLLKLLFGLVFDGFFFKVKFLPCGILMVFVPCLRATVNILSKIHVFRSGKIWKCWSFCSMLFCKSKESQKKPLFHVKLPQPRDKLSELKRRLCGIWKCYRETVMFCWQTLGKPSVRKMVSYWMNLN